MEFCIHFLSFSFHALSLPHSFSLSLSFPMVFSFCTQKTPWLRETTSTFKGTLFRSFTSSVRLLRTEKLQNVVKNVSVLFSLFLSARRVVSLTNTSPFISACITLEDLEHLHHNKMTYKRTDERVRERMKE